MIFEVIKLILKENGSTEDEACITAQNILKGFRKFPKHDTISVMELINKLKGMVAE